MIPNEYLDLCRDWHNGQSCMMYAISSTGDLTKGSIRPLSDEHDGYMTDAEWEFYLYSCLSSDIYHTMKVTKNHEDYFELQNFYNWSRERCEELGVLCE